MIDFHSCTRNLLVGEAERYSHPMRILLSPDKFAGTLTAQQAADAMADGWRTRRPGDEIHTLPLADGGPGFLDAVLASRSTARVLTAPTSDPLGRPLTARFVMDGEVAYIESAEAVGLHLLSAEDRDPARATSFGLGLLIAAAVEAGARRVYVGLGGSAVNDAGAGMLVALGYNLLDDRGFVVPYGAAPLATVHSITGFGRMRGAQLIAATDVDSPLTGPQGATYFFGPQKGVVDDQLAIYEAALAHFSSVVQQHFSSSGPDLASRSGAGAAGGIGMGLFALGAQRESGSELVATATGLDQAVANSDVVITGEGSFDLQSLRGKVAAAVAGRARVHGVQCHVIAGQVAAEVSGDLVPRSEGVSAVWSLTEHFGSVDDACHNSITGLNALAAEVATQVTA